jgi:hypothetical protein
MYIVTESRIDLAIDLIDKLKRLFNDKGHLTFDTKETVIKLKWCQNRGPHPSHHLDAIMRTDLANVFFIFLTSLVNPSTQVIIIIIIILILRL